MSIRIELARQQHGRCEASEGWRAIASKKRCAISIELARQHYGRLLWGLRGVARHASKQEA